VRGERKKLSESRDRAAQRRRGQERRCGYVSQLYWMGAVDNNGAISTMTTVQ